MRFQCSFFGRTGCVLVLIGGLLFLLPPRAKACDPGCDAVLAAWVGAPTLLGTTIVAPLIGRALDTREHSPYWISVGMTAVASGVGILLVASGTNELHGGGETDTYKMIAVPALMGSLATLLVYLYSPRPSAAASQASAIVPRAWSVEPVAGPGTLGLRLRFEIG